MITADEAVMLSTPDSLAVQFAMGRVDQAIREAAKQYRSSAEVSFNAVGYPGSKLLNAVLAQLKDAGFKVDSTGSEDTLQISW